MKNRRSEAKFKSTLGVAGYLLGRIVRLGAVTVLCSSAPAQNLFVSNGSNIYI